MDEHKAKKQLSVEEAITKRRTWLLVVGMFVLLCAAVWLDEILDLPRFLLSGPQTPINWHETAIETVLLVSLGLLTKEDFGETSARLRRDLGELSQAELTAELAELRQRVAELETVDAERERAEEALKESEERCASLFDRLPVGLYRTTPEGQILDVNSALVEMLGYPDRETLLTLNTTNGYVNPEDRTRWQALMNREGAVPNFGVQWRRYDGTALWVKDTARAIHDADGRVLYYEGVAEDITERKRAEEALQKSEERHRSLTDDVLGSSAVGIFILDSDFRIVWVNQALERYFGLRSDEIVGKGKRQLIRQRIADIFRDPENFAEKVLATYDNNTYVENFECCVLPDGEREERWLEHWSQPIRSGLYAGGRIEHYYDITERKRTEEALRESEEKYRTTLDNIEDGYFEVDLAGNLTFFNDSLCRILGYSRDETMGMNNRQYMDKEGAKRVFRVFNGVYTTGKPAKGFDWEVIRKDGAKRIVESPVSLIKNSEGEPIGFRGVARDITERKQTEEALRESKRQLESRERFITNILGSIPTSLVVIDRALRIVSVNHNFLEKTRREEQATLSRKVEEVFPQVLLKYTRLDERVQEIFRTGEPVEGGKFVYRAPSLPTRTYYYRLIPLSLSPRPGEVEGGVENVMLLMDDVTEREKLGEEVRRSERHLASVVDSANDLMVSMDAEGRILTWNRAAEGTSGFRPEGVKGQYLPNLCVKEDQQKMGSWLAQLARGRFTGKSVEINLRTNKGEEVPISWAGSRMLDDERRLVGLVAVGRDLTERKRLEAQLIQSAKLTSLGVMAGGIAHEIRNPLAISSAAAQLLLERPDDEEFRREAAEKIYSGIQRASYIIENLLKFARPPEERMVSVDVGEVLTETLALLANQLRVQRVGLRRDFASELPQVMGNKSLLQQVFSNMILNACNAMPDGGSLNVITRVNADGQVEIAFADTGCGIPEEDLSKLFDPFFTTMPVGKGIGLGLSISYSIIKQHQGTIEVESQMGQGSTFTVRLPGT
jgi:PAS domain S-box-containing protein